MVDPDVANHRAVLVAPEGIEGDNVCVCVRKVGAKTWFLPSASQAHAGVLVQAGRWRCTFSLTRLCLVGFLLTYLQGSGPTLPAKVPPGIRARFPGVQKIVNMHVFFKHVQQQKKLFFLFNILDRAVAET